MSDTMVAVERHGDVALLRMERSEALNALDDRLATDLMAAGVGLSAARPGEAVGCTKRLLDTAWTSTFETQLEEERAAIVATGRTAAHRKALACFLGRSEP